MLWDKKKVHHTYIFLYLELNIRCPEVYYIIRAIEF